MKPLCLTLDKAGAWTSHQTTKSVRGCKALFLVWCRKPTNTEVVDAIPALGEWPMMKSAVLDDLVQPVLEKAVVAISKRSELLEEPEIPEMRDTGDIITEEIEVPADLPEPK